MDTVSLRCCLLKKKKKWGKKDYGLSKESGKSENDEHHDNCIFNVEVSPSVADVYSLEEKLWPT